MLDRFQLEAFATVTEYGSFEQAANALNITRGAVSQRIKTLEEALSTVLLVRERPPTPTAAGEVVLRYVKALRLLEHDVYVGLKLRTSRHKRTPIAIAVNSDSLATWFDRCSEALLQQLPVALEISVDDQGHTRHMLTRGDVTGCISTECQSSPGFNAIPLGAMTYRCAAAPAFAQHYFPRGLTLHDAKSVPAVLFNRKDSLHDTFLKSMFGVELKQFPRHYFPSPAALLSAIRSGNGYGLIPVQHAEVLLKTGQLVDLAPGGGLSIPLFWHHWQQEPPLGRQVTGFVVEFARTALDQAGR
ncbi:HTH-type transcriptional regulator ArgP [Burkholderia pyrrocinia]|uniref:HTH-type transcriptional regulator ArgP n=1 Tax=Burkholderia sp. IT-111MI5 TaxID=3026439 RepID=UPI002A3012FD|nr:HTH-type transcriptional regulator ArgP [Burkholderia pyrrocinia]EKS9897820.1 HTH-type transcriptional regulator ArgP [Burkholderia pyrrocinia]EKS9910379.1 HTH-type transcriptional regulator ArgP [Burkholderia pyrrocinia]